MTDTALITAQDALIAVMMGVTVADENIRTAELVKIHTLVNHLPVFADYDADRLDRVSRIVFDLLDQEDGLDALFGLIRGALPERLYETGLCAGLRCGRRRWPRDRVRGPDAYRTARGTADRPPSCRRHRTRRAGKVSDAIGQGIRPPQAQLLAAM